MYFANQNGVLEFDGAAWNLIPVDGDRYANALAIDSSGRIYVGGINDLGYLRADSTGTLRFVSLRPALPDTTIQFRDIWCIFVLPNEVVFSSENFIFRYAGGRLRVLPARSSFNMLHYVDGRLLVDQPDFGLCEVIGDSLTLLPDGAAFKDTEVNLIIRYDAKRWLIMEERGWHLYDGRRAVRMRTEADEIFRKFRLYRALELPNGHYAIASTGGGVVVLDRQGRMIQHIDKSNGLQSNMALHVYLDRQYGLWVPQFIGISRIDILGAVTRVDARHGVEGLPFNIVREKGRLNVVTVMGLYEQQGTTMRFKRNPAVADDCRGLIAVDGDILAGCIKGVYAVRNGVTRQITDGYTESFLRSSIDTTLVYVLEYGLRKLYRRNGAWKDGGMIPGAREVLTTVIETKDGALWVQTLNDGILHFRNVLGPAKDVTMKRYGLSHGFPSLAANPAVMLDGVLRIGFEQGMFRFDSTADRFVPDPAFHTAFDPPLPFENLRYFSVSDTALWVVSNAKRGASRVQYYVRNGTRWRERPTSARQLNDMNIRLLMSEQDGTMWFSNEDGLYAYRGTREKPFDLPFAARLRSVAVMSPEGDSLIHSGAFAGADGNASLQQQEHQIPVLPFRNNALRFSFAAISYDRAVQNEYQFLLEGQETEWSQWSAMASTGFTNLAPGTFTFRVRARNAYGIIGREATFQFVVLPPWYRTWWFITLVFLVFLASGPSIYLWRVRRLEREKKKQEQFSKQVIESQERERRRISSELHDSLGQNLLILKNMIDMGLQTRMTKGQLMDQLRELSGIAVQSIEETRAIASNLHPYQLNRMGLQRALLALVRNLEQSTKLSYTAHIDRTDDLFPKEAESHLFRIVQESVNNILKHAGATHVQLALARTEHQVRIVIADNGRGFDPRAVEQRESLIGGLGLFGLRERAKIIGASLSIVSAPGNGTTIEILIPIPYVTP